jgi:large repetitive protein
LPVLAIGGALFNRGQSQKWSWANLPFRLDYINRLPSNNGKWLARLLLAAVMLVIGTVSTLATPFTTSVPGTSLVIPSTYPQAGGVVIVLEGVNGNVYYQFVNPSTMFQGYQNTGTPTAWQGNPFQITPVMTLFCGPVVSCSTYLGGGITRMTVRFTAYDGDNQTGMFDFNDLNLRINGSNFGASSGNWSPVSTQNTDLTGTTLISSGTGFGNNTLDTGWFQSTDPTILSNVLSVGTVTASIFDRDPNDNFWDFKRGNDANTSTVPLNVAPGVTLDKASTTSSYAAVGEVIPYTFTYRNIGSVWINNVSVSDPKVTSVSCPAPPAAGTANLDPGEQVVCTANYTVTQADIDAGSIVNTATATGTAQAGSLGPVSDSNTIAGPASAPAVRLTKAASPSPFGGVGTTLTYSFAVENLGNVTLSSISIADPSLASLSCTSPSIAPGATVIATCSGNTRTITQANVDNGVISNVANVTARAPNGTLINASSTISTMGPASAPAIALVKSASAINDVDSNGPDAGDTISYSFAVSNTGNVTLTGVVVSDPTVGAVNCPSSTIAPAASISCSANYSLQQSDFEMGSITNSATATGSPPSGPTVSDISGSATSNDDPTVTALPAMPALTVDKTSSTVNFNAIGALINYSYLVTNAGNITLLNPVSVVDDKTAVSCPALPPSGLAPGGSITCTANYTATQADIDAGGVTNTARAETTFGPGNTPVISANDSLVIPAVQLRAMNLTKSSTSFAFINVGDVATYEYVVTNTGNTSLSAPLTITDNRVTSVSCPSLPPGGLAPGGTLTCSSSYSIVLEDLDLGSVTNLAFASSGGANSPQVSVTIPTGASPALTVVKSSTTTSVNAVGSTIPYSFLVTNTGNATFTRPITIVDDKIGTINCWTPTGPDPTFTPAVGATPAESIVCTANYVVTQSDFDSGAVTNQAYASTIYGAANIPHPWTISRSMSSRAQNLLSASLLRHFLLRLRDRF